MKKVKLCLLCLSILIIMLIPVSIFAEDSNVISMNEKDNPENTYYITNKYDLNNARHGSSMILMNDIVFEDADFEEGGAFYNNGKGWESLNIWSGTFDGNGHAIVNLQIHNSSGRGLFDQVSEGAVVKNLELRDFHFDGEGGGSIAVDNWGTIENCFVSGDFVSKNSWVGGICDNNFGTISECVNNTNMFVENGNGAGIATYNEGIITDCINLGRFFPTGENYINGYGGICMINKYKICNCISYTGGNLTLGAVSLEKGNLDGVYFLNGSGFTNESTGIRLSKEDLMNINSFAGFDFDNVWEMNDANTFPILKNNPGAQKYLNNVQDFDAKPKNLQVEGFSYNSIKLSWEPVDGAVKYIILRKNSKNNDDFYSKYIEVSADKCTYIDKSIPSNSNILYMYQVIPVFEYNGIEIISNGQAVGAGKVIDTTSDNGVDNYKSPIIHEINLLTETAYRPGTTSLHINATDDDCGISSITIKMGKLSDYGGYSVPVSVTKTYNNANTVDEDIIIPLKSSLDKGDYAIRDILVTDASGNTSGCMGFLTGYKMYVSVTDEFDVEFTGVLSNVNVVTQLKNMEEGKTVVLTINEASKGILKKEILDAIKGQDKTVVVYADSEGSLQWVFYGKDIVGKTKDLNLNVSISKVAGAGYGVKGSLLELAYSNNGQLPGNINFRVKSNFIKSINGLDDDLYLYHLKGKKMNLENSNCQVIKDGSSYWCYLDLEHNSKFYLSGSKLKNPIIKHNISLSKTSFVYDGKYKKPTVNIKGLTKGTHYTVTYKNNKKVGTASVVVKGKGQYAGTITKTFKINPKAAGPIKLTKGKKQFTVKWTKRTIQATGYQIKYSTKKNMSNSKFVLVKSYKTNTKTIKNLKSKQKYWVQVRTYKTVNGTKYYSSWSKYKTVKTK